MYHEVTYRELERRRFRRIVYALFALLVVASAFVTFYTAQISAQKQGAVSLREAVVTAARQCCAVEGSYPSSIEHLKEHYGLVVNEKDYDISYEWLADNIMPTVAVTRR